ncbi:hypothetical protein T09_14243 [Trichinella sp. T9]|nr:hypothetical protein T09_15137 [Trichinella sp. T9]KRX28408.1 hypothetical protein T09_14243 [Trichinella sp. T9]
MVGKVLQHRNNIMRIRALIPRFRSIYRRPKRATQV